MYYTEKNEVLAMLPIQYWEEALADQCDGEPEKGTPEYEALILLNWKQVQESAQMQVNGFLSQQYSTPFSAPLPPLVRAASLVFVLENLYQRRGYSKEANPFTESAKEWRAKLDAIGKGEQPLMPSIKKTDPGIIVTDGPIRAGGPINF